MAAALVAVTALAACDTTALAPRKTTVTPQERPVGLVPKPQPVAAAPKPVVPKGPSPASLALEQYYTRVQADLLVRGLLRTDGGGPDTVFTDTMLARNFENIALADEYVRGAGLQRSDGALGRIKKWQSPVRINAEFGAGVPAAKVSRDRAELSRYASRLGRITGHPVSVTGANPNFHVLFMAASDMPKVASRIRALVPDVSPTALTLFDDLPRDIHCLVYAFSDRQGSNAYDTVIAVIRSEHPDLLRKSCIHEEVAQGFGLGNDNPRAHPSIFNDDDEFAFLTTHDEMLLRILYDPRLTPGMSAAEARPIIAQMATQLTNPG